jgi:hypothetical protein
MCYNKNKELCSDLNKAAQPSDFARYTGDDKDSREIRKEKAATAEAKDEKEYFKAIVEFQLG